MKSWAAYLLLAWGWLQIAGAALAAEPLRDDPRARQFFEVGAQAYKKGQYLLAIDAFEQAFALTERPGLLFSLAQAHQRQFRATGDGVQLLKAIDAYRKYLTRVPEGGRRADAEGALEALLPLADKLQGKSADTAVHSRIFGRLLLSSATPGVVITVNGEPVESLPTSLELPEAHYHVVAAAKGYAARVQDVAIAPGAAVPLSVELEALPARLEVQGPNGAELLVDGRSMGWLPIAGLSLAPGEHSVSLRRPGFQTRTRLARLERGQTTHVSATLETTLQRRAAWVALGGAVVATGLTATFAGLAASRDGDAKDLKRSLNDTSSLAQAKQLNDAVDARDRFKTYALVSGISGAALLGAAAVLYFGDTPAAPAAVDAPSRSSRLQLAPLVGDTLGLVASGRF